MKTEGFITTETKFSNKVRGRMRSAFDRSGLQLVGGDHHGKTVVSRHLMPALDTTVYTPSGNVELDAVFNANFPFIAGVLLGSEATLINTYVDGIGGNDVTNLPQVAADIVAKGADESGTVFRMVYGASEQIPVRALSYPVPVFQMMEKMQDSGITPPQLQIVSANHLSSAINNISYEQASDQSRMLAEAGQAYVGEFFPALSERVAYLEDAQPAEAADVYNVLDATTKTLIETGQDDIKIALLKKGVNPSEHGNMSYGAAHLLFHDVVPEGLLQPLVADQPEQIQPSTIVSVGGHQEHFFYHLRSGLREVVDLPYPQVRTLQLFTRHHVPPYYMARGSDIALEEMLSGSSPEPMAAAKTAQIDLTYLQRVSNSRGDFGKFVSSLQERRVA